MAQLIVRGYDNYKGELRVQMFDGDPDRHGREIACLTQEEAEQLRDALTRLLALRAADELDEKLDDIDPSPDCRCETCPQGGPYTCISTD